MLWPLFIWRQNFPKLNFIFWTRFTIEDGFGIILYVLQQIMGVAVRERSVDLQEHQET
jgi:hypothetical protein